jgi:hypothetical protein
MDEAALELGVYFVLVSICSFLVLDQVKGKIDKLDYWLLYRRLEMFKAHPRNSTVVQ